MSQQTTDRQPAPKTQETPAPKQTAQSAKAEASHNTPTAKESKPRRLASKPDPVLRFSPTAWAKLLFFRDHGNNEIGGFGVTARDDLLLVQDFVTVKQQDSMASILFDDEAVAEFFEQQVEAGRRPEQFARLWLHTHPGDSPRPSTTDEETFQRVFGHCDWAVMFVLAATGKTYARLRFNVGPGGSVQIPVEVDFDCEFGPSDREAWEAEYKANVRSLAWPGIALEKSTTNGCTPVEECTAEMIAELENMHPTERQLFIEELAGRPDLWDEESEVMP